MIVVKGIPVTTVARTMVDVSDLLRPDQMERVLEQAVVEDLLDVPAIQEQIEHNRARRGARRLAKILGEYDFDLGQVLSEFEAELRTALRKAGLPQPLSNIWIVLDDGDEAILPDLPWPAQRLVVQADGFKFHRARWKFEKDTRNDQRLVDADWIVIRLTYLQLKNERARLIKLIAKRLAGQISMLSAAA
jgi:hypothetical protein